MTKKQRDALILAFQRSLDIENVRVRNEALREKRRSGQ